MSSIYLPEKISTCREKNKYNKFDEWGKKFALCTSWQKALTLQNKRSRASYFENQVFVRDVMSDSDVAYGASNFFQPCFTQKNDFLIAFISIITLQFVTSLLQQTRCCLLQAHFYSRIFWNSFLDLEISKIFKNSS